MAVNAKNVIAGGLLFTAGFVGALVLQFNIVSEHSSGTNDKPKKYSELLFSDPCVRNIISKNMKELKPGESFNVSGSKLKAIEKLCSDPYFSVRSFDGLMGDAVRRDPLTLN